MTNYVVWFDMPVSDLDRAMRFYARVLDTEIRKEFPNLKVGLLPQTPDNVSGCLNLDPDSEPGTGGPLLYFNVNGRLGEALALIEPNGGQILKGKHPIGPFGFRAVALDSEGNRIALHSFLDDPA